MTLRFLPLFFANSFSLVFGASGTAGAPPGAGRAVAGRVGAARRGSRRRRRRLLEIDTAEHAYLLRLVFPSRRRGGSGFRLDRFRFGRRFLGHGGFGHRGSGSRSLGRFGGGARVQKLLLDLAEVWQRRLGYRDRRRLDRLEHLDGSALDHRHLDRRRRRCHVRERLHGELLALDDLDPLRATANDVGADAILDHLLAGRHELILGRVLRGHDALGHHPLGTDRDRRLVTQPERFAHARNLLVRERALRFLVANSELFDLRQNVLDRHVPFLGELVDALLKDQPSTSGNRARNRSRSGLGTTQRNERTNPPRRANVPTHVSTP